MQLNLCHRFNWRVPAFNDSYIIFSIKKKSPIPWSPGGPGYTPSNPCWPIVLHHIVWSLSHDFKGIMRGKRGEWMKIEVTTKVSYIFNISKLVSMDHSKQMWAEVLSGDKGSFKTSFGGYSNNYDSIRINIATDGTTTFLLYNFYAKRCWVKSRSYKGASKKTMSNKFSKIIF